MRQILVSGSRGFIGGHLVPRLARDGHALVLADRAAGPARADALRNVAVGDIGPNTDWREALKGCDCVVHLAAQTSGAGDDGGVCDRVNAQGTQRLLQQAAEAGVSTVVLLSSVMALVDNTATGTLSDATAATATSAYGRSKLVAEAHVAAFARDGRVGVSLRPPLVYGRGAKGNWRLLQRLAASGLPLPFGAVANRRTLCSVGNLVDAIAAVIARGTEAPSGTYLVSDIETVSLADIVRMLRRGAGRRGGLVAVPPGLLRVPLQLAGRAAMADSLLGDLEIDSRRFRIDFTWSPAESTASALNALGAGLRDSRR